MLLHLAAWRRGDFCSRPLGLIISDLPLFACPAAAGGERLCSSKTCRVSGDCQWWACVDFCGLHGLSSLQASLARAPHRQPHGPMAWRRHGLSKAGAPKQAIGMAWATIKKHKKTAE